VEASPPVGDEAETSILDGVQFYTSYDLKSYDVRICLITPGSILSLVQKWLKNCMDTPMLELAKILVRLMRGALR
jgi:hypothetical protein